MSSTVRDSDKTRKEILDALGRILVNKGFPGVGINAVAREAGVDKVLIYRYFGSMDGLLGAFRDENDLCPGVSQILDEFPKDAKASSVITRVLLNSAGSFRENVLAQELVRWELTERNPLTAAFSRSLEQNEMKALEKRGIKPDDEMVMAVTLIMCGLQYMILRQTMENPIMDIDLADPDTARRLEAVVGKVVGRYFADREEIPYVKS